MAPSFDCAVSSLLCGEEDYSIFCDEFDYEIEPSNQNQKSDGDDSLSDLPVQSDECLDLMVKGECEQLPNDDYLNRLKNGVLDLGARMEAVDWIWKVHAYFNFGPLCAYLAVSYLDRFLSAYELPKGKAWTMQLLAVACLSVAAKMEETEVPLCVDLQVGESKFVFEARTIQKMELLVLSTLKWRMQAITPFSFIDYFLNKINGDKVLPRSSIYQSTQLILNIIKGIDYLKFRPSEVAAAVAVYVTGETQKTEPEKTISLLSQHVEKEKVLKCVDLINKQSLMCWPIKGSSAAIPFLPPSPIGVLDAACLSYKTDDKAVGSCTNSSHNSPQSKRRKLNMSSEVENIEGMWCGE